MNNLVNNNYIIISGIIFVCCILFYCIIYIYYTISNKYQKEKYEQAQKTLKTKFSFPMGVFIDEPKDAKSKFRNFLSDWLITNTFVIVIMFAAMFFSIGALIIAYDTRCEESINYYECQVEYQTLSNIVNQSEDIINQDIYKKIVNYNKKIAHTQAAMQSKKYSINFTGEYDWNKLQIIELK